MERKPDHHPFNRPSPPVVPPFARRVDDLRQELSGKDIEQLAFRCAGHIVAGAGGSELRLEHWGTEYSLAAPEWIARQAVNGIEAPLHIQGLLLYHLLTADGTPIRERWIAFADLPSGRFYNTAFQGYTGGELAHSLGADLERFSLACQAAGGKPVPLGDQAFRFNALPRLPILAAAWAGDEDFPPAYRILFDESAPHYLPTDVCAILGSMLTRRILKASQTP